MATPKLDKFELYNIQMDRNETSDLKGQYPEVFAKMKAALIAYDQEVLAEGPDWWKKKPKI